MLWPITRASGQMEDFPQVFGNRAAVRIGIHDVPHVSPPSPTRLGGRDGVPPLNAFDFDVTEQKTALAVQVDRVIVGPCAERTDFSSGQISSCRLLYSSCAVGLKALRIIAFSS
jgi:hypothetical protein